MRKKAFTLVELIVVISVVSLLMAILMPALVKVRQQSKSIVCLSNLRQMVIAANAYTGDYDGHYPLAHYTAKSGGVRTFYVWDFITTKDWGTRPATLVVKPGILWGKNSIAKIQQCPSFKGGSNTSSDPYTGYNYNTSYIGYDETQNPPQSSKVVSVMRPAGTALFGDGQYSTGANKFMRAPLPNPRDASFSSRFAGTQGYRHLGKTNVAFCDGHARAWNKCYTNTSSFDQANIAPGTGFLSPDNSAYDLE